jgi:hypothetical protein
VADTWTINYEPTDGGRFTGKLTVDSEKLHFTALYDSSNSTIVKNLAAAVGSAGLSGGNVAYISDNDAQLELELPRSEIASTEARNSFLAKRVVVTMQDGSSFVFNYGMLSVKKLVAAIKS